MGQQSLGTINPATESGTALATLLSAFGSAWETLHAGATAPTYTVVGLPWQDTSGAVKKVRVCYDVTGPKYRHLISLQAPEAPGHLHSGGRAPASATDGTDQTPVNTEVYICEVMVPKAVRATGISILNGSVASGNVKVGIADISGAVLATSVSTAMSGTAAYQRVPFTATVDLDPGIYFVLVFVDNGTARIRSHVFGDFGASKQTGQTFATGFTTISPPTTFTTNLGTVADLY